MSEMESKISLPSGGGSLACWERHYAVIEGADIKTELGLEMPGKQVLVGKFTLGSKPGRYWHDEFQNMPRIYDGGCSLLRAYHIVGEHENTILAECSTTIGGEIPRALPQPVTC
ncbi:MAG: hypothetical protein P0Y56_12785 [Candidatus Andeanibacterium colombiense]|uniref:Uncharacterized protein n=1 Tax=Candidatus Andeanibacterium colombiense TaxID=3121345 RepID=A0AAJ6BP01_9SPHN|nr:MAG: hypothetical protein P0Y56_12785 [Sphingomonadaceae bacterium]